MSGWQKIAVLVSILWMIGLPISKRVWLGNRRCSNPKKRDLTP